MAIYRVSLGNVHSAYNETPLFYNMFLKAANGFCSDVMGLLPITNKQQTPWPLVRERTIPTERPPLVDEI
jgi:hypothetical protein